MNSTAWMRIKLGSSAERRGDDRRSSDTNSNFYTRNKSQLLRPHSERHAGQRGTDTRSTDTRRERERSRLTLHFVGVGLLAPRHRGEDDDGGGGGGGDDDDGGGG